MIKSIQYYLRMFVGGAVFGAGFIFRDVPLLMIGMCGMGALMFGEGLCRLVVYRLDQALEVQVVEDED